MGRKHKPEEIVAKLRQVDVLTSQGKPVAEAIRAISVTEVTYYRWRNEYGGLKGDQVKRLKELEAENARLRRESFNSKLRDELLKGELFYTLQEARIVIERWRQHYNTVRLHSSLGYRPPAPEAIHWPATRRGPAPPAPPPVAQEAIMQ
jgi:transposase InsO family protein